MMRKLVRARPDGTFAPALAPFICLSNCLLAIAKLACCWLHNAATISAVFSYSRDPY